MLGWIKKRRAFQAAEPMRNPFRSLIPALFDKGEKVNRLASELQRIAAAGTSSEEEALTALGNAVGYEVAALTARHPHMPIDETLDLVCKGIREQAHLRPLTMCVCVARRPQH